MTEHHRGRTGRPAIRGVRARPANPRPGPGWPVRILLAAALVLALPAGGAHAGGPGAVTAVTWNLYLGADITRAVKATSPEELLAAGAEMYRVVHATNFPERAEVIAARIVESGADVVAVQEAALWLAGPRGDGAPATTVVFDFLRILEDRLAALRTAYDAVVVQENTDSELPVGDPYNLDVRMVDRDAILVKRTLDAGAPSTAAAHFEHQLTFSAAGRQITATRGWASADLTVAGRPVRFVNTHLEAFDHRVRTAQAHELVAPAGPVGSAPGDVVLLGDLNTGPELPVPTNREAFHVLTEAGLVDTWAVLHPGEPGFTAGFGELLDDPSPAVLEHRVDHVMIRGGLAPVAAAVVGACPGDRTRSGMWPSDHAGLVATMRAPSDG